MRQKVRASAMGPPPPVPRALEASAADLRFAGRELAAVLGAGASRLGDHLHVALGLGEVMVGTEGFEGVVGVAAAERQADGVVDPQPGRELAAGIAALAAGASDEPGPAGGAHRAAVDLDGLALHGSLDAEGAHRPT